MPGNFLFALEKFPDNMNVYIHESSFKTNKNILGSLEKFIWYGKVSRNSKKNFTGNMIFFGFLKNDF